MDTKRISHPAYTDQKYDRAREYWRVFKDDADKASPLFSTIEDKAVHRLLDRGFGGLYIGLHKRIGASEGPAFDEAEKDLRFQAAAIFKSLTIRVGEEKAYELLGKTIRAVLDAFGVQEQATPGEARIQMAKEELWSLLPGLTPAMREQAARNDASFAGREAIRRLRQEGPDSAGRE